MVRHVPSGVHTSIPVRYFHSNKLNVKTLLFLYNHLSWTLYPTYSVTIPLYAFAISLHNLSFLYPLESKDALEIFIACALCITGGC